jgi:hypothetical protein
MRKLQMRRKTVVEVTVPHGHSPFGISFVVLQCLVNGHGGEVSGVEVRPDVTANYTVRAISI